MAVLSDRDILRRIDEGTLQIVNLCRENVAGASIDFRLGNKFRVYKYTELTHIDTKEGLEEELTELVTVGSDKSFTIHPGEFVLGTTMEYIKMPDDLIGRIDGRSSLGRLGIVVHSTAGSIDPGFEGQLTLEIANISRIPVKLWPGMRICRVTLEELSSPSVNPYYKRKDAKYLGQKDPAPSKISHNA
jgi:dCTP deaminase